MSRFLRVVRAWRPGVIAVAMLGCFSLTLPLAAQQTMAAITGVITDPSGAPVPGAQITVTNVAQGTPYVAVSNQAGIYNLPRLPVGQYTFRVTAKGFETVTRAAITLVLDQTANVNFRLRVGSVTQTVEVTGAPPLLQTQSTQVSTIINSRTVTTLPLATRDYVQLTLLAPGSIQPNPSSMTNGQATFNGGRPYINGNREQSDNFLLDGADNNQVSENAVAYTPAPDALAEFDLITNNASAEYGNFQGGIINASIKSGTNHWHGDLYEFFRNNVLNANNWANNWQGTPRPQMRWNQFGGTIGGPILHNKLFIFGDYEGERFDNPASTNAITVLTMQERQGDFSQLLHPPSGAPEQLYNPDNVVNGQRQPFVNNQIPINMIDPVAKALFADTALYPAPINGNLINNQYNTTSSHTNVNQGDVRVDATLSPADHLFVRYSELHEDIPTLNSFPLYFDSDTFARTYNVVADWTHTIGADFVNEARLASNYTPVTTGVLNNGQGLGDIASQLGIAGGNSVGPGLLALQMNGNVGTIGSSNVSQLFNDEVIQYEDQMVWTRGRHLLHFGFQGFRERIDSYYSGNNGAWGFMNYSGQFTSNTDVQGSCTVALVNGQCPGAVGGAGEADFFLGLPNQLGRGVSNGVWGQRANIFAAYLQDDFRATDHLTLNLGLRYENHTPWVEVYNRQVNFLPFAGTIEYAGTQAANQAYTNGRALYDSYNGGADFQPRLGFAWSPAMFHDATVIRGAYTLSTYMEGTGTNLRLPLNPPLETEYLTNYNSSSPTALPGSTSDQGLTVLSNPSNPFAGATLRLWDPHVMPAVVEEWNFTIQHQFNNNLTWQVGYVGQHGTHLMVPVHLNQLVLHSNGLTSPSPYLAGNPTLANEIGGISGSSAIGNQRYDALQSVLKQNFSNGLQFQVAYTYSKCMTDNSGYYGSWGGQTTPSEPYADNLYNLKAEWGPCFFDSTHTLSSYAVYALPVGKGKAFNLGSVGNAVLGNWQSSAMWQWHGGFAMTPDGPDTSTTNNPFCCRMNCVAPAKYVEAPSPAGGIQWFSASSYAVPTQPIDPTTGNALGVFGSCGNGVVRGPGLDTLDVSLQRIFPFTEARRVEFRADFINFTNTPILDSPDIFAGFGLGRVTGSQGERNIQFALKFYF